MSDRVVKSISTFHWLHFSDLHFSPEVRFDTQYARARLFEFLHQERTSGCLPCDYIFFTGDIAHKGNHDGVHVFANQLFNALCWNTFEHTFWAVGNHDISRQSILRSIVIDRIRSQRDEAGLFEEFMEDPEIREVLLSKCMHKYNKCHIEILLKDAQKNNHMTPHAKHMLKNLNLIVLNTCITSCDGSDEHNLHIKECGLQNVFAGLDESKPTFVIGHHGTEYFKYSDQDAIEKEFESNNVDLYLCGHAHRLGHKALSETGCYIPQITCGGGVVGSTPSKFAFIHGCYNSEEHSVLIKPYSYEGNGNKRWHPDEHLHPRLNGVSKLELRDSRTKPASIKVPVNLMMETDIGGDSAVKKDLRWSSGFFSANDEQG